MKKTWDYQCPNCKHEFEDLVEDKEKDDVKCPKCGTKADRIKLNHPVHGKHTSWPVS